MLDWKKWEGSGMSLMDFLVLNIVYQDSLSKLPFNPKDELSEEDFKSLLDAGYIRSGTEKHYMTVKGANVFIIPQTNFQKFFELFPHKVSNGRGGYRMLRASEPNSKNGNEAYRKWRMVTASSTDKEEHLIKCLQAELSLRKKQGDLLYMNNILTWFNQKKWEFYEHLLNAPETGFNVETSI